MRDKQLSSIQATVIADLQRTLDGVFQGNPLSDEAIQQLNNLIEHCVMTSFYKFGIPANTEVK